MNNKLYFVYILKCSDDTYYIGQTTNLARRLNQHNGIISNGSKYTRSKRPVYLVYYETAFSKSDALKREYQLKKLNRIEKKMIVG